MNKKVLSILIMISIGFLFYYFNEYKIENNNEDIQSNLKVWLNRGSGEELEPNVLKLVQIQDTTSYITLFQIEEGNYGNAHLIKGLNGKFKVLSSGHGDNLNYQIIETNKGMYIVLYGENPNLKINHIIAKSRKDEFSFKVDVSKEKTFVKYKEVPSNFEKPFPTELTFFDENYNEIEFAKYLN